MEGENAGGVARGAGANEALMIPNAAAAAAPDAGQLAAAAAQGAVNLADPVILPDVAGVLLPRGPVQPLFDIETVLLGPLPKKTNKGCTIIAKITGETWP